jgi:phospholipid/cholesterol/gamma-HCH transport system ATP-binding protein
MKTEIIKVSNLAASFYGTKILNNVSFSAWHNQITVILGASGSGKTTVLKHIIGLYPVTAGSIYIMGNKFHELGEERQSAILLKMGVLFQNGALLNSLTVGENVAIPLEQHTNLPAEIISDIVRIKLNLVGLLHAIDLFPEQLSGGMKKRAALARALSLDPPLLLCDEPSAGLDPVTLESLDNLLLKLKKQLGMTVVIITHEVSSIFRLADRVVFMDAGTVVYEGSLKEALKCNISVVTEFFFKAKGKTN